VQHAQDVGDKHIVTVIMQIIMGIELVYGKLWVAEYQVFVTIKSFVGPKA